jgi:hypothetical protein
VKKHLLPSSVYPRVLLPVRHPTLCSIVALVVLPAVALGGPVESAIVAAMKLPDAPSYSWRTEVSDDVRTYEIAGSTERAGDFSSVTLPMVTPGLRRGPRGPVGSGASVVSAWFKGAEQCVIQVDEGWRRPDEMQGGSERGGVRRGGFSGPPGMGGPRAPGGPGGQGRGSRGDGTSDGPAYSNLQNTISRPHEEIGVIVAGASEMKVEGEAVSGVLSETAAKLLLVHDGQKERTPLRAAGTFRLWVREGALVKYETRLQGVIAVEERGVRREVAVNQTALTALTDVGTAKVEVPAEVRKKLGG